MSDNELLRQIHSEVQAISSRLNVHLAEEEQMMPHLLELVQLLQMSKGAVIFIKVVIFIATPIVGFIVWAKSHITL